MSRNVLECHKHVLRKAKMILLKVVWQLHVTIALVDPGGREGGNAVCAPARPLNDKKCKMDQLCV